MAILRAGHGRSQVCASLFSKRLELFQGMFDKNLMTFNPGWTSDQKHVEPFTDVREIQRTLKKAGIALQTSADESTARPASFVVVDPDGNAILFNQHR